MCAYKFRNCSFHSNGLGDGGLVVNAYDNLSDTVKLCAMYGTLIECAKIAEDSGVQMNLEALNITTDHVGNFLQTTRMAAEMIRLIGSPKLRVLYDAYHMQLNEGRLCDNVKAYGDAFGHIHVADAILNDKPTQVTGEDGLYPILIAAAATKSMKEGRPVKLSEIE